ncbi:MAG: hypothetical protein KDB00_28065, partial [Planctomycetales bacterium]|nr:hypothetical protein [Planctomycetales bacterium]
DGFSYGQEEVNDAIKKAFEQLSEHRTWNSKFGESVVGKPVRVADGKIYLINSEDQIFWVDVRYLIDSTQPLFVLCSDDKKAVPLRVAALESLCRFDLPDVPPKLAELASQPKIYELLKEYTGEDFGYDQQAWYKWAKEQMP